MKEFKFLFNKLPFHLIFYPTSRCNAYCQHCYNHNRQEASVSGELSIAEIEKISRKFSHLKILTISGGEPFLREDLAEIISIFYKNNGLQYLSLHTNAFLTDKVVATISLILDSLKSLEVIACISLDGVGKEHDRLRRVEGGFDRAMETIKKLQEIKKMNRKLDLVTSTIFSHSTQDSFGETISFVQKNFKGVKPSLGFIRGDARDASERKIDAGKYEDFYRNFKFRANGFHPFSALAIKESIEALIGSIVINNYKSGRQTIPCQAGRKLIVIYENGDVYPCEIQEFKFGNLRDVDYDISKLLFSKNAKEIKRQIRQGNNCHCTWENVIPANLLFSPMHYPSIINSWLQLYFK